MVEFPGDDHFYYAWFISRRYGIQGFTRPYRKPHITFINDSVNEITVGEDESAKRSAWEELKKTMSGREVSVRMSIDVRTNGDTWWLKVLDPAPLMNIRSVVGLGDPYWSFHMTVAQTNERSIFQSTYAYETVIKKYNR